VPGGDFQDEEDLDFDQDIEQYDEQGGQHDDQVGLWERRCYCSCCWCDSGHKAAFMFVDHPSFTYKPRPCAA
jgi:hypothetical protein